MSNLSLKQQLSHQQLAMVQSEMEHKKKSMALAYVFLIFLGTFGAHRFYVGKKGTAITQLVLTLLGYLTLWLFGIGLIFLGIVWIWVLIDLFLLYGHVNRFNEEIERELIAQVMRQNA
jgi:TM2 domain-containing membrane protein YozV